jgi:hypothetical protein
VLAIVALGVLLGGTSVATANGKGFKTLRLEATTIQQEFLDLGTPGPSLGDELIISERLTKNGREVGTSGVVCTVTQVMPPYNVLMFHCVATLKLNKGQITLQGLIEVQGENDQGPFVVAITGGTDELNPCGMSTATYGSPYIVRKSSVSLWLSSLIHVLLRNSTQISIGSARSLHSRM